MNISRVVDGFLDSMGSYLRYKPQGSGSLEYMVDLQYVLSGFQGALIIGPILGSPVKALISSAELIAGVAGVVIFGAAALIPSTLQDWAKERFWVSLSHSNVGFGGLFSSALNVATLGIWGIFRNTVLFGFEYYEILDELIN